MVVNSRWKLYALIGRNIGKNLSDILNVDDIFLQDFILSYDDLKMISSPINNVYVYSLELRHNVLWYYNFRFFYRENGVTWIKFDIDSILNNDFEDIV